MGTYFKPWHRKIGVATLVIACVFAGGWIRGGAYWDGFNFPSNKDGSMHAFGTSYAGLVWTRLTYVDKGYKFRVMPAAWQTVPVNEFNGMYPIDTTFNPKMFNWRWQRYGFDFGQWKQPTPSALATICVIPYWSIVIPLTLLSAWLLLSKPRTPKSVINTE